MHTGEMGVQRPGDQECVAGPGEQKGKAWNAWKGQGEGVAPVDVSRGNPPTPLTPQGFRALLPPSRMDL